ncbi:MAG: dephospho-CoA kinase [Chlamydiia bacterium]|nr:dephospho-CoA kinase [Chlamydiia bacterium]
MLELKKIAITGGIASGKTTVCRILEEHGACALNSDKIIHNLLKSDPACIKQVVKLLGSDVLTDGKIDRKKVADIVFSNREKLKALEAFLHPLLLGQIDKEYKKAVKEGKGKYFVVELPLVQEIGKEDCFDCIIAVVSNENEALKRFTQEGFTEESFRSRSSRQWDTVKKAKFADFVIENYGTVQDLEKNVLELMKELDSQ